MLENLSKGQFTMPQSPAHEVETQHKERDAMSASEYQEHKE